jgi:hypothetical protein
MSRPHDALTLRKIVEMRGVQRLAAEMGVARANAALAEVEVRREGWSRRLRDDQKSWSESLANRALSVEIVGAWAMAIHDGEAALRVIGGEITAAEQVRAERAETWGQALAREKAAEKIAATAMRKMLRRREETALGDAEDRFAQRRRPA